MVETKSKTLGQLLNEWHGYKAASLQRDKGIGIELLEMRLSIFNAFQLKYGVDERYLVTDLQRTQDLLFPHIKERISTNCSRCVNDVARRILASGVDIRRELSAMPNYQASETVDQSDAEEDHKAAVNIPESSDTSNAMPGSYVYIVNQIASMPSLQIGIAKIGMGTGTREVENLTTGKLEEIAFSQIFNNIGQARQAYAGAMIEWRMRPQDEVPIVDESITKANVVAKVEAMDNSLPSQIEKPKGIRIGSVLTNGEIEATVSAILSDRYEVICKQDGKDSRAPILFEEIGKQWMKLPQSK
jgi:hypothetical protein